ncbi:MAG: TIGR04283 family arsenosugar biosynthesis glycosyltransferase [Nitrospinota bacterium]|nr:TIGR04283 family arsenosugar biosynthesis glycosyltransferase [Nitrospinota bacterium]
MIAESRPPTPSISIIVPALSESGLESIATTFNNEPGVELVFALCIDDPSTHAPEGCVSVRAPRGRASQMNAGAKASSGDILIFLHADTRIPPESLELVRGALARPGVTAGAYLLRVEGEGLWRQFLSAGANVRSRYLGLPFGDQAIFITRAVFQKIGGYEEVPILEDVRLIEEAARIGKIVILPVHAATSPRRWEERGIVATTLRHWGIMIAYKMGASPRRLARWFTR